MSSASSSDRFDKLGVAWFGRFALDRGMIVQCAGAKRFVAAAKARCHWKAQVIAGRLPAADLALLDTPEHQITDAEEQLVCYCPPPRFEIVTSITWVGSGLWEPLRQRSTA